MSLATCVLPTNLAAKGGLAVLYFFWNYLQSLLSIRSACNLTLWHKWWSLNASDLLKVKYFKNNVLLHILVSFQTIEVLLLSVVQEGYAKRLLDRRL